LTTESYTFTLPSCVANGDYLLRIEQLGIHNPWPAGIPQFYIGCAQIRVTGGGSGLSPSVAIPGHVSASDPGYTANVRTRIEFDDEIQGARADRGLDLQPQLHLLHRSRWPCGKNGFQVAPAKNTC
jgi:hypothetical protein